MKKIPGWLRRHKGRSLAGGLAALIIVLAAAFLILAKLASWGAAQVFNTAAAHQHMLKGTITVESIHANTKGGVTFENLAWDDPQGQPILRVPRGSFQVRVWDVVTRHLRSTSITELTLIRPAFAVAFDKDMRVDFVNREEGEKAQEENIPLDKKVANFNRSGKTLKLKINVQDARLESFYENRHYKLSHVNIAVDLDTKGRTHLDISTGRFGGDAVGDGISLYGDVDFGKEGIPISTDATATGVDPSSLGFGDSIHDKMTITTHARGPIAAPTAEGTLSMEELHIPALDFSQLKGDVHYEDGHLDFQNVTARVYGGTLSAHGDYDVNTRAYNIYAHGESLDSRIPTKEPEFYCLVDLDGELHCDGNPRDLTAEGSFTSSAGFYKLAPFESLSGSFSNRRGETDFYDVRIETKLGTIKTDALHIIDGNVQLSTIQFENRETGETMDIAEAGSRMGPMGTVRKIQQDLGDIKRQLQELKP